MFQNGDNVFMAGVGSSPKGDRPFLDRFNLKTGAKERIFQTEDQTYEPVLGVLSDDGSRFITQVRDPHLAAADRLMRGREADSRRPLTTLRRSGAGRSRA